MRGSHNTPSGEAVTVLCESVIFEVHGVLYRLNRFITIRHQTDWSR